MYGLVNQAVKQFVIQNQGDEVWKEICREAGVDPSDFSMMRAYPDEVTYNLVGAATKVLGLEIETVLEVFGESWPDYAKSTAYSRLMDFGGSDFVSFLENLDQMHAQIKMSLPELNPPSFDVTDVSEEGLTLHYFSDRPGLAPMIKGILRGLARQFEQEIEIELVEARAQGADHDVFSVRFVAGVGALPEEDQAERKIA